MPLCKGKYVPEHDSTVIFSFNCCCQLTLAVFFYGFVEAIRQNITYPTGR